LIKPSRVAQSAAIPQKLFVPLKILQRESETNAAFRARHPNGPTVSNITPMAGSRTRAVKSSAAQKVFWGIAALCATRDGLIKLA